MLHPDNSPDPFGEPHHGLLDSVRNRAIAVSLAVVIAAGVGEAETGFVRDKIQAYKDGRTLVENIYYDPYAYSETEPIDLRSEPVVTVTELKKLKAEDKTHAAQVEAAFEKTMDGFYDGLDFFRELNNHGIKEFNNTEEKIDFAGKIRNSLNGILNAIDDHESDGVELFKSIVNDDIQKELKEADITLDYTQESDKMGPGASFVTGFFDESGKSTVTIYFVPDFPLKDPELIIPPAVNPEAPTETAKIQVRIFEMQDIMRQALRGRKEQVAQTRVEALLESHPDLRPIHERHVGASKLPGHNESYSPSAELEDLKQILQDRKHRKLENAGPKVMIPRQPVPIPLEKKKPILKNPTNTPELNNTPYNMDTPE